MQATDCSVCEQRGEQKTGIVAASGNIGRLGVNTTGGITREDHRSVMPKLPRSLVNKIICGDAKRILQKLPDESIDCVVTSPPYWALRDYGAKGQIGLEASFEEYIETLCGVFDEVKRVLKRKGTCWVNMGDTYSMQGNTKGRWSGYLQSKRSTRAIASKATRPHTALPRKCILQIPARFAIEMINRGWILRNEIIWWKPNVMPSSAKDRFTVDFEKMFFFVKGRYYYFAQQFEPLRNPARLQRPLVTPQGKKKRVYGDAYVSAINPHTAEASRRRMLRRGRNKRCVWPIATRPYRGNHFAVYPPQLVETPIKAGCPKGGIVLDPFIGSGTTAIVARVLGRKFIGIELNPEYVAMAQKRLARHA